MKAAHDYNEWSERNEASIGVLSRSHLTAFPIYFNILDQFFTSCLCRSPALVNTYRVLQWR